MQKKQNNQNKEEKSKENKKNITLEKLLKMYTIKIPEIQRDYAQGRNDIAVKNIRDNFLDRLFQALINDEDSIKLDYIYGYTDNQNDTFYLIDGQQRITTLWLLYIYIYCKKEIKEKKFLSNFAYYTSENATEFTKQISNKNKVADLFGYINELKKDKKYEEYMLDQSIYSFVNMLEAIKKKYDEKKTDIGIDKLKNITFDVIDVKDKQTGENLYLKMNSRGKPLSAFENFKAWLFENKDIKNSCAQVINNDWIKFFWKLDKSNYDKIIINFIDICTVYFYFTSMCKKKIDNEQKKKCIDKYNELKDNTSTILIKSLYMDDKGNNIINLKAVTVINNLINKLKDMEDGIAILSDTELANKKIKSFQKIFAMLTYFSENETDNNNQFLEWYKSMWRVVENTRNNSSSGDDIIRYFNMLKFMSKLSADYTQNLSKITNKDLEKLQKLFGNEMLMEEAEKAKLISNSQLISDPSQKGKLIEIFEDAYKHDYFKGKIGFLIKHCTEDSILQVDDFESSYNKIKNIFRCKKFEKKICTIQHTLFKIWKYCWPANNSTSKTMVFGVFSVNTEERLQWYHNVFEKEEFKDFINQIKSKNKSQSVRKAAWWEKILIEYGENIFPMMKQGRLKVDNDSAFILSGKKITNNDINLFTYGFYCYCTKKKYTEDNYIADNKRIQRKRFVIKIAININKKGFKIKSNDKQLVIERTKNNSNGRICIDIKDMVESKKLIDEYNIIIQEIRKMNSTPKNITRTY